MKNNTVLSIERINEMAKDYDVPKSCIYLLYKALINNVDSAESFEKAFLVDPEFSDRILEYAVSMKSSSEILEEADSDRWLTDDEIAFYTLRNFGFIDEEIEYIDFGKRR